MPKMKLYVIKDRGTGKYWSNNGLVGSIVSALPFESKSRKIIKEVRKITNLSRLVWITWTIW